MLDSSHLLIKNIIINHIFWTLEDIPGDCRLHRLTSWTGSTEKGFKGPGRSEDRPPRVTCGPEKVRCGKTEDPHLRLKVFMQNLFGSQVFQIAIKIVWHRWENVTVCFPFFFFLFSTLMWTHPSVDRPTSNKYVSTPVPTPVISEPSGSPALLSFTFQGFHLCLIGSAPSTGI